MVFNIDVFCKSFYQQFTKFGTVVRNYEATRAKIFDFFGSCNFSDRSVKLIECWNGDNWTKILLILR